MAYLNLVSVVFSVVALVTFSEVPNAMAFLGATIVAGTSIWVALSVRRLPARQAG
jgi:drug/metabolite transporter (DMT)-like permease